MAGGQHCSHISDPRLRCGDDVLTCAAARVTSSVTGGKAYLGETGAAEQNS